MATQDIDGTWAETPAGRQLVAPSDAWKEKAKAPKIERAPKTVGDGDVIAVDWAKDKKSKEDADASDSSVTSIKNDVTALKATVKAMSAGNVTLTKAQTLTILRGLLYLLKDDKTA